MDPEVIRRAGPERGWFAEHREEREPEFSSGYSVRSRSGKRIDARDGIRRFPANPFPGRKRSLPRIQPHPRRNCANLGAHPTGTAGDLRSPTFRTRDGGKKTNERNKMKSNRQTPGSPPLLIDAAAQAAGRGSGLPNLLNGNRPILGGFINLALRVLRSGSPDRVDRGLTEGRPKADRSAVRRLHRRSSLTAQVQSSTALGASHHGQN